MPQAKNSERTTVSKIKKLERELANLQARNRQLLVQIEELTRSEFKENDGDTLTSEQSLETIQQREEMYRLMYEHAPLPYQSLNEQGVFQDVNLAWLRVLGYKRKEVIGKKFADFLHPDWKPQFNKKFPIFKKRGYVYDVRFKIRHKNGHYLDISFEGCIGYYPDGRVRQTYCIFQDISERLKSEQELVKTKGSSDNLLIKIIT